MVFLSKFYVVAGSTTKTGLICWLHSDYIHFNFVKRHRFTLFFQGLKEVLLEDFLYLLQYSKIFQPDLFCKKFV